MAFSSVINNVPLNKLPQFLARYNRAVLKNSYTQLGTVAKSAVDTMRSAVAAAPPTKHPKGPPATARRLRRQQIPDMPLIDNGAIATGKYRDDWKARRMRTGDRMGVLVYNSKAYAPRIEYGRRPGRSPPVQAIRKWLQIKFSLPYRRAKKLAFPIAKAIARDGIPGRKIMTNDRTVMTFNFYLEEALNKALSISASEVFR